jgi:hypothetical protein
MKLLVAALAAGALLTAAAANAENTGISCSELPQAAAFVGTLKPGPNTRAAERHLEAAKSASSEQKCVAELRQVDHYARRSAAADRRQAAQVRQLAPDQAGTASHQPQPAGPTSHTPHVLCADALHQDRPGGSDYHGPPAPGCTKG